MKKVIVVGSGIGGLATAAILGKEGFNVTVIEKNKQIGGRARVFEKDGYKFDMGPSWYMMRDAFERFFSIFNKKPSDFYNLKRLDTNYKVFFDKDRTYKITSDIENNLELFEKIEKGAAENLKRYLRESKYLYEESMKELVFLDYESIVPLLNPKIFTSLPRLNLLKSFHKKVEKYFNNKDLQKIIEFTTVFLGGSPYNTPAFYTLISHTDFNMGIWYPMGGIHKIIQSLEKLCYENNVEILTDQNVIKIKTENGRVKSVFTDSRQFDCDSLVCNADYNYVETQLLDKDSRTYPVRYWESKTYSPGGFIIYLGVNKKVKNIEHHNLYFDPSWEKHFDDVYANPNWPDNPSYYVHCPSKTDASVAPPESDSLMFLVPVATGLNDSDENREIFYEKILSHFENLIGDTIKNSIDVKRIFSHRDFITDYHSHKGSAFGIAHTLSQTSFFRPRNRSKKVKNLYYVGQNTNPGIGMPTTLISSQITAKLVTQNER